MSNSEQEELSVKAKATTTNAKNQANAKKTSAKIRLMRHCSHFFCQELYEENMWVNRREDVRNDHWLWLDGFELYLTINHPNSPPTLPSSPPLPSSSYPLLAPPLPSHHPPYVHMDIGCTVEKYICMWLTAKILQKYLSYE